MNAGNALLVLSSAIGVGALGIANLHKGRYTLGAILLIACPGLLLGSTLLAFL